MPTDLNQTTKFYMYMSTVNLKKEKSKMFYSLHILLDKMKKSQSSKLLISFSISRGNVADLTQIYAGQNKGILNFRPKVME